MSKLWTQAGKLLVTSLTSLGKLRLCDTCPCGPVLPVGDCAYGIGCSSGYIPQPLTTSALVDLSSSPSSGLLGSGITFNPYSVPTQKVGSPSTCNYRGNSNQGDYPNIPGTHTNISLGFGFRPDIATYGSTGLQGTQSGAGVGESYDLLTGLSIDVYDGTFTRTDAVTYRFFGGLTSSLTINCDGSGNFVSITGSVEVQKTFALGAGSSDPTYVTIDILAVA